MGEELHKRRKVLQRLEDDIEIAREMAVQEAVDLVRKPSASTANKPVRGLLQVARREYKLSGRMFGGGQEKEKSGPNSQ